MSNGDLIHSLNIVDLVQFCTNRFGRSANTTPYWVYLIHFCAKIIKIISRIFAILQMLMMLSQLFMILSLLLFVITIVNNHANIIANVCNVLQIIAIDHEYSNIVNMSVANGYIDLCSFGVTYAPQNTYMSSRENYLNMQTMCHCIHSNILDKYLCCIFGSSDTKHTN